VGCRPDPVLDGGGRLALVEALIIAGFTGRNRAKVQEHIDEMRAHGVPIPDAVPTFYPVPMTLLTRAHEVEVSTAESSGEVEPVLVICDRNEWYLTLGSDHTARDIEKTDIARSKAACPKIVCGERWAYEDVRPHWDRIELSGWAVIDGKRQPYQRGRCAWGRCRSSAENSFTRRATSSKWSIRCSAVDSRSAMTFA
jgi:hypothetical protein